MLWDGSLIDDLSVSLLRGDLIIRAIEKCRDIKVIEQVVNAYLKVYPASLQGLRNYHLWTNFDIDGDLDVPPVIWACSHNRTDVLELLHTKNNENGKDAKHKVDINIIFDRMSTRVIHGTRVHQDMLVDAWQAAFYGLGRAGVIRNGPSNFNMSEDACIWLLKKNLGFSTRPGGISIDYLSAPAAYKKVRVVRALIAYFKARLSPDNFQNALTGALYSATGAYYNRDDGHEEIIDILVGAGTSIPPREDPPRYLDRGLPGASLQLRQSPARTVDAGLLARAVRSAPRNAVYLLRLQMEQNMTDYRDVKAALSEALLWGNGLKDGGARRLEFFKMVFPEHVHLAYSPAELLEMGRDRSRPFENLVDSFIGLMRSCCSKTYAYDVALYVVQVVGRARVGAKLVEDVEHARSAYYSSVLTQRRVEFYQSLDQCY
ncbi:hypothetical protein PG993_011400 [Apiospora rasikravindrae]|uniref:Uncharacterized protein n=1 Tax=Apiospora rasikravindrae TaxID=990691 RepID=A0ABR1SE59_9PEZI